MPSGCNFFIFHHLDPTEDEFYFPFIPMGVLLGTNQIFLPNTFGAFAGPINIPGGFPFGSSIQNETYVSTCKSCFFYCINLNP